MTQEEQKWLTWLAFFGLGWMVAINFFLTFLVIRLLEMA
jgi:hypothetical protein